MDKILCIYVKIRNIMRKTAKAMDGLRKGKFMSRKVINSL